MWSGCSEPLRLSIVLSISARYVRSIWLMCEDPKSNNRMRSAFRFAEESSSCSALSNPLARGLTELGILVMLFILSQMHHKTPILTPGKNLIGVRFWSGWMFYLGGLSVNTKLL